MMEYKIALLLRDPAVDFYKTSIGTNFLGCNIDYYHVSSLKELGKIFSSIEKKYDGFMTTGSLSLSTMTQICSDNEIPMSYFNITVESIYKIILTQSILRNKFDLSKIGIDILDENDSLANIIVEDRLLNLLHEDDERVKRFSLEELQKYENDLIDKYSRLINNGKINFFITRTIAALDLFNKRNIDYYFMYPSINEIRNAFELLKKNIELRAMKKNLPAVIHFDLKLETSKNGSEQKSIEFQKAIIDFNKKYYTNLVLKSSYMDFEVYTDYQTVKDFTFDFTHCPLLDFLKKEIQYSGTIGYGIGRNIDHARINAINASKYGNAFNENGYQSFLVDSDDNIISLNKSGIANSGLDLNLNISIEYADEIAQMAKLSSKTIMRLISLIKTLGTDQISSDELMMHLNISLRTSNKILSNLHKCGIASIEGRKSIGAKGRPINVYKVNICY